MIYGTELYSILEELKAKISKCLDDNELDPINKDFFKLFNALITFLDPSNTFSSNEVRELMLLINESCFSNIQKYNLNEKPIKIDGIKEDSIKEYVKGMKLNITNYKTYDPYFLNSVKSNKSLINEVFVAVKLINLSVSCIFNLIDSSEPSPNY